MTPVHLLPRLDSGLKRLRGSERFQVLAEDFLWTLQFGVLLTMLQRGPEGKDAIYLAVWVGQLVALAIAERRAAVGFLLSTALELLACWAGASPHFAVGVFVVCAAKLYHAHDGADTSALSAGRAAPKPVVLAGLAVVCVAPWLFHWSASALTLAEHGNYQVATTWLVLYAAVLLRANINVLGVLFRGERERAYDAEAARDRAVAEERALIARELHDVVAHQVSVVVAQAQGAEALVGTDPSQVRRALATISDTAREALVELRRLVTVSRETRPPGNAEPEGPQPGLSLADLGNLGTSAEAAGLEVEMYIAMRESSPLSAGLALAAYRTIQESLTNAAKHAPGSLVKITVDQTSTELTVDVVNGPPRRKPIDIPGAGVGVIGMIERAQLFGGSLHTGPTPEGGWSVRAIFPTLVAPPRSE